MTLIELHTIVNHCVANLNRDDANRPKSFHFNNVERAFVSSQNRKFTWRHSSLFRRLTQNPNSHRTTLMPAIVGEMVVEDLAELCPNLTQEQMEEFKDTLTMAIRDSFKKSTDTDKKAKEKLVGDGREYTAEEVMASIDRIAQEGPRALAPVKKKGKKGKDEAEDETPEAGDSEEAKGGDKNEPRTPQVMALSINDFIRVADSSRALVVDASKKKTFAEMIKKLQSGIKGNIKIEGIEKYPPDIALFGRMVTDPAFRDVDAACQVSPSIGVTALLPEMDFWTATDDVKSTNGAGGMGTAYHNASCLYDYANVNVEQLLRNLAGDREALMRVLDGFLRTVIMEKSKSKQNTYASYPTPTTVLITINRTGEPISLAKAFETPVIGSGDQAASSLASVAMLQQMQTSQDTWFPNEVKTGAVRNFVLTETSIAIPETCKKTEDVEELVSAILSLI